LENEIKITGKFEDTTHNKLKDNYYEIVISQNGSRNLQKIINFTKPSIVSDIFAEIKDKLPLVIINEYGNYFCPKLYKVIKEEEKILFIVILADNVLTIGKSKVGTYPLQAIIDQFNTEKEKEIMLQGLKNCNKNDLLEMCFVINNIKDKIGPARCAYYRKNGAFLQ